MSGRDKAGETGGSMQTIGGDDSVSLNNDEGVGGIAGCLFSGRSDDLVCILLRERERRKEEKST